MPSTTLVLKATIAATLGLLLGGCGDAGSGSGSGATTAASSAAPATSASAAQTTSAAAAPTATASAAPRSDCPKGSSGEGTLKAPCLAKGKDRMMEVVWTGKMGDDGPSFKVTNKSTLPILFGKVIVYFYDKAGKQIEVKDETGKPHSSHGCSGNLFAGVMKPGEKATITFSCVTKKDVPDGAAAIEAELSIAGFADASEKRSEFFWHNADLTPDNRPKGGIK